VYIERERARAREREREREKGRAEHRPTASAHFLFLFFKTPAQQLQRLLDVRGACPDVRAQCNVGNVPEFLKRLAGSREFCSVGLECV
jgi:hypothetical protein